MTSRLWHIGNWPTDTMKGRHSPQQGALAFSASPTRWLALVTLTFLLSLLSGCTTFVLARAQLVDVAPEVTASPTSARYSSSRQVALAAPDSCAGAAAQAIVHTACGVEMAEVERALKRSGFSVSSWKNLYDMVTIEHLTPIAAAKKLNADVLFQVNVLQRIVFQPNSGPQWRRVFLQSDKYGAAGAPVDLSQDDKDTILSLLAVEEYNVVARGQVVGVMLDIDALAVSTGESMWSYRAQRFNSRAVGATLSVLMHRGAVRGWRRTHEVAPALTVPGASYSLMMREICDDFVAKFLNSKG